MGYTKGSRIMSGSDNSGTTNGTENNTSGGTTEKRTRESRNNHGAAESHPITDATTAQAYCDAVRTATANDKPSSMFNGSGFVTPTSLDNQDTDNLVRMSVCISDALARKVTQDGEQGQAAQTGLDIIANHARNAAEIQEEARNKRILAEAEAIKSRQRAKTTSR
jgi:hypothetical protein